MQPACRNVGWEEVITKGVGAVTFTTSIIESNELAWPCGDTASDAAHRARCAEAGAAVAVAAGGRQCTCQSSDVYYVQNVDHMAVAFEHGYSTSERFRAGAS